MRAADEPLLLLRKMTLLIGGAIAGHDLPRLLAELCESLVAAGVPLSRASLGALLLNPQLDARHIVWRRGQGVHVQDTPRPTVRGSEVWRTSPFYELLQTGGRRLRRRFEAGQGLDESPVLAEIAAHGATDYLALRTPVAVGLGQPQADDIYSSWTTDRPGGFAAEDLRLIDGIEPLLGLVTAARLNAAATEALLCAYLGADAARRVLGGAVERGRADTIEAVIWHSDLESFTRLTDTLPRSDVLELLNGYAEMLVEAIESTSGEVLKFTGDGILAIFRAGQPAEACAAALTAWTRAHAQCAELSAQRSAAGLATTRPYLGLHVGEVLYGNIGGRTRLDFTVLGPAVNEVSRIAALCRSLDQQAVLSERFAMSCANPHRQDLVSLGRFALRGVEQPQMLFTLDPALLG